MKRYLWQFAQFRELLVVYQTIKIGVFVQALDAIQQDIKSYSEH